MQIRFGPYTLDLDTRQLTRAASAAELIRRGEEIHLSPKAFDLLATLAAARPDAVAKEKIQQRLWPQTFVAEANLSNLVAEVREALGDRARAPRYIRTVHGFGYAFFGETTIVPARGPGALRPVCWIEWGARRFPLSPGEHVAGRDPDVEIHIDAATVSRRHARLVVTADGATLEDVGSKNGTSREGQPVTTPVRLADGDAIGFGSLIVIFHFRGSADTQTETVR